MSTCSRCGHDNAPLAASCARCGTTLAAALPASDAQALEAAQAAAAAALEFQAEEEAAAPASLRRRRDGKATASARRALPPGRESGAEAQGAPGRQSERGRLTAFVPFAVAVVVAVGVQVLLDTLIPPGTDAHRILRPADGPVMAIVPGLILFLFVWTAADLLGKWWRGRTTERDLARPEIKHLPTIVGREPYGATLQRLQSVGRGLMDRSVGRRLAWLLSHLDEVDPRRAHELLRHQSDLDNRSVASRYRIVTLFAWAMPILGVIGTVLGISLAVGGFSEIVATNVGSENVDSVTAELGNAASSLSLAFTTTIVGLLAGLVASVLSAGARAREERSLTRLDELSMEIIARAPSESGRSGSEVGPVTSEEAAASGVGSAVGVLSERVGRLSERTEPLMATVETALVGVREATEGLEEGLGGLGRRVTRMEEANERLASSISEFGARLDELREAQAALRPALTRLTGPLELRLTPSRADASAGETSAGDAPTGSAPESHGSTTYQATSDRRDVGGRDQRESSNPDRVAEDPLRSRPPRGAGSGPDEEVFD